MLPNSRPSRIRPPFGPETNGPEGTVPTTPALGLRAPGTPGRGARTSRQPQQPYSRSPELSDRLTQIARTKGRSSVRPSTFT